MITYYSLFLIRAAQSLFYWKFAYSSSAWDQSGYTVAQISNRQFSILNYRQQAGSSTGILILLGYVQEFLVKASKSYKNKERLQNMYFKLEEATIIKFGLNPRIKCLS